MRWEVIIPGEGEDQLSKSVTVEAINWLSALKNGLRKQGMDGKPLSNLSCVIEPDQSVTVSDFVTRQTYTLRPLDQVDGAPGPEARISEPPVSEPPPAKAPVSVIPPTRVSASEIPPSTAQGVPAAAGEPPAEQDRREEPPSTESAHGISGLPDGLLPHRVFFERDEESARGNGVCYRERMIAVSDQSERDDMVELAKACFEQLTKHEKKPGDKFFINLQIYDHAFEEHSLKPAIVTLTWKEWSQSLPEIGFPLSGDDRITYSSLPAGLQAGVADGAQEPAESSAASAAETDGKKKAEPQGDARSGSPAPAKEKEGKKKRRRRLSTPPPQAAITTRGDPAIEDKMVQAFERMQEIYEAKTHDDAAVFALSLARDLIPCAAGSCMLISPGRYELYVAAAMGPIAEQIIGTRLSLSQGLVGFTTRVGVVINVSDPASDPRFNAEVDEKTGFETRSIACAPVQFEGRTIGAIELINSPEEGGFPQDHVNILSYIAGALAEYVDTSLPSREADFTDRDFREFLPSKKASPAKKKGVGSKSAPQAKQRSSQPLEADASGGKGARGPARKKSSRPGDAASKKKKGKKKK